MTNFQTWLSLDTVLLTYELGDFISMLYVFLT